MFGEKFVKNEPYTDLAEGYYAVDGNMLYAFDNIYGVWTALGVG